jgi:hypothetical protein
MTLHAFDTPALPYAPVVQAHVTIAINLGPRSDVTVSSAVATPTQADAEPSPLQIAPGPGAHAQAHIDDLVSDADEFTSVPSTAAAPPVTGDVATSSVQADGSGNGHTILVG